MAVTATNQAQTCAGVSPTLTSEELASILDLSARINDLLDLDQILAQVSAAARGLLESDMSTVLILDEEKRRLEVAACDGVSADVASRLATPLGDNLAGRVADTGKPIRCADVQSDSRSRLGAVAEAGIRSAMLAPLEHHGEVIGVLSVQNRDRRKFSHREQTVLQLLANQAATAIEKARLYALERGHVDELQAMVDRINSQNEMMRRSRDAHEKLTRVALQGLGVEAVLEQAARQVDTVAVLVNKFGRKTCAAASAGDERIAEFLHSIEGSHAFEDQIQRLREEARSSKSEIVAEHGFWRIVPAVAAGEVLGFIVVLDHESLDEADVVILEQAANIVASEFLRERSVVEAETRMHGDLLQGLLAETTPGSELQERAALLGHDLAADQCIVVVRGAEGEPSLDSSVVSSAAAWASASKGLKAIVGCVGGQFVGLLSAGDRAVNRAAADAWIEAFSKRIATLGAEDELSFGVSAVVSSGAEVGEAFRSADQAVEVGRLNDGARITHFGDVELLATVVSAADPELLRRFVRRSIGAIEDYDVKRGSSLAETLEVYLDRSRVARHAAKALFLHPHSLRYRLRRIGEIQGTNLDDPNERLMVHLALKLRSFV